MAIRTPGQRFRWHRILSRKSGKRSITASLDLTAMVDMFTVLVIFLLQNYDPQTKAVLYIPEKVDLPSAQKVESLKPAVSVSLSDEDVFVDAKKVMKTAAVKSQPDWMLLPLFEEIKAALQVARQKEEGRLGAKLRTAIQVEKPVPGAVPAWSRITIQSDRSVDFLTVKKIMYTITEAGAGQINFAVTKDSRPN